MKKDIYQIKDEDFISVVKLSKNIHEALKKMGLNAYGSAYKIFNKRCNNLQLDLSHFISERDFRKQISSMEIEDACASSISRQEALSKLKLNPQTGANVIWITNRIRDLNIDTTSWLGKAHMTGKINEGFKRIPLSDILIENSNYTSNASLKIRLLREGLLKYHCYRCGISEWLGEKLSLQLEHKNGNHTDNRIENLCLLCPNCHSLTDTFAGKNINKINGGQEGT